jgi:hypothetical protein
MYVAAVIPNGVIVPTATEATINGNTVITSAGVQFFFNNGAGRSAANPLSANWPRNYNSARDMQIVLNQLPTGSSAIFPEFGIFGVDNYGIPLSSTNDYRFAIKKQGTGYIIEGRMRWKKLLTEFVDPGSGEYTDVTKIPNKTIPGLGFDMAVNFSSGNQFQSSGQMMWNQCCYNANWTQSQFFGYLDLSGDITGPPCPSSITITTTSNAITTPLQQVTVGAVITPINSDRTLKWEISGTSNNFPLAVLDNNVISPLNNGNLTITATSVCTTTGPSFTATYVLPISGQVAPTNINISGSNINSNWGYSNMTATVFPSGSPQNVTWTITSGNNLATVNSITGEVRATGLGNGNVTVRATSLANGITGDISINISNNTVVDCMLLNSYTKTLQCNRTLNTITFLGFNIGDKIQPLLQYYNPLITSAVIPDDLVDFSVTAISGNPVTLSKSGGGIWELQFNQVSGTFTITGTYLNDPSKTVSVTARLRGAISSSSVSCPSPYDAQTACIGQTNISVNSLSLNTSPTTFSLSNTYNFSFGYLPINASTPVGVSWNSSNPSVGTIDANGQFVALAAGSTNITVSLTSNSSISASRTISVISGSCILPSQPSTFSNTLTTINQGIQTYSVTSISGVSYSWQVSGNGNFVSISRGNEVEVNWVSSGTLTVTPSNTCGAGTARSLVVTNVNAVGCTPPAQPGNFDKDATTVCQGNVTYTVPYVAGLAYQWSVSGLGNSIFVGNGNQATINWQNPGTVSVTPQVGSCQGTPRTLTVISTTPPAVPTISANGPLSFCQNSSIQLTSSATNGNRWSNGAVSQSILVSTSGSYTVTVGDNCSSTSLPVNVTVLSAPVQDICFVGISETSGKNIIVFEKPSSNNISNWRVMRETSSLGVFDLLKTINKNDMSTFTDEASLPATKSYRYRIDVEDTCGNISEGLIHQSMHLTINKGLNNKTWNLLWSEYEGKTISTYRIYRGTSESSLTYLDGVAGSSSSYTDSNAPEAQTLFYVVEILTSGCNPTARTESYDAIRSNVVRTDQLNGILEYSSPEFNIHPNPNSGAFSVDNQGNATNYVLYNAMGTTVNSGTLVSGSNKLDLKLSSGIYLFKVGNNQKKIVIE